MCTSNTWPLHFIITHLTWVLIGYFLIKHAFNYLYKKDFMGSQIHSSMLINVNKLMICYWDEYIVTSQVCVCCHEFKVWILHVGPFLKNKFLLFLSLSSVSVLVFLCLYVSYLTTTSLKHVPIFWDVMCIWVNVLSLTNAECLTRLLSPAGSQQSPRGSWAASGLSGRQENQGALCRQQVQKHTDNNWNFKL